MRKMLNTLYITSEDAYASLKGDTIEISFADGMRKRIPLLNLESIVMFSYQGASPTLMGECEARGIPIVFYNPFGKYLATVGAAIKGNVLLRRQQNRIADNEETSLKITRNFILGKIYNSRSILLRGMRDHPLQVDCDELGKAADKLQIHLKHLSKAESLDSVRGIEGVAASDYFGCFDELILQRKDIFFFNERNRRPPTDSVNAMLSFGYTLLANDCVGALLSVGLDPYIGFMHTDRPGRKSLALDLMEELRGIMVDRLVLTLINNRVFDKKDFVYQESGAVEFSEKARKEFLTKWQARKREEIVHPFLKEKVPWGLVPYSQALLLSRFIRGDMETYPPFLWR